MSGGGNPFSVIGNTVSKIGSDIGIGGIGKVIGGAINTVNDSIGLGAVYNIATGVASGKGFGKYTSNVTNDITQVAGQLMPKSGDSAGPSAVAPASGALTPQQIQQMKIDQEVQLQQKYPGKTGTNGGLLTSSPVLRFD